MSEAPLPHPPARLPTDGARAGIDVVMVLLLLVGITAALGYRLRGYPRFDDVLAVQVPLLVLALFVSFVRPMRERAARLLDALRRPSRVAALVTATLAGVVASAYLWASAYVHGRELTPRLHDEFSYLTQATMLARGRLFMPALPTQVADFFESFHILTAPAYGSKYFPGTAMLYVPGVWLGLSEVYTAVAIAGLVCALMYLVTTELLDGAWGLISVAALLAVQPFRLGSTLMTSHVPAMLGALLVIWCWLRWWSAGSGRTRVGWAVAVGAAAGWAAIVRPLDLLAYAIPIASLTLWRVFRSEQFRRQFPINALLIAVAMAPFLAMQLRLNRVMTGRSFTTPFRAYIDTYQPRTSLGFFTDDPSVHPETTLQQKHDLYDRWIRWQIRAHRPGNLWSDFTSNRLGITVVGTLPSEWFLIALPAGVAAAWLDRRRWVMVAAPFGFLLLYSLNIYYLQHHPLVIAPGMIFTCLSGFDWLMRRGRPAGSSAASPPVETGSPRALNPVVVFITLAAGAVSLSATPEANLMFGPDPEEAMPKLAHLHFGLPAQVRQPAVVFFTYRGPDLSSADPARRAGNSYHAEPVYNYSVPWPLDAPIMRVHDLGTRNIALIDHLASRQPDRTYYRFDRTEGKLYELGPAEAARAHFAPITR